jgi:arabinofuranosyltransferase
VGVLSLGFAPFLAWEIFSIIYYGFPFPNTAYAKISTGIPAAELIRQGWCYFENSMRLDPLTLPATGCALLAALGRRGRHLAIAAGIALYGLYVLRIGGDFMSGRFLAVPLFAAMAILGSLKLDAAALKIVLAGGLPAALWLGLSGPHPPLLSDSRYDFEFKTSRDIEGVADERAYYYQSTGLLRDASPRDIPTNQLVRLAAEARQDPTHVVASPDSMGILGYYAGPSVHLVDALALPDPLLARLPVPRQVRWRIGHFRRFMPDGYVEGLRSGRNELTDLRLRRFHDQLLLITRGPIFRTARWRAILDMNFGRCADLVDVDSYRHPPLRVHTGPFASDKDRWTAVADSLLPPAGAWVYFGEASHATRLEITLDRSRDCRILYPQGPAEPVEQHIPAAPSASEMQIVQVPETVSRTGFDRLLILPSARDNACYVARIRVLDPHAKADQP